MRTRIDGDDARLVNHLVPYDHEPGRLHDLIGVPVNAGQHRSRQSARDAALPQAEILRTIERSSAKASSARVLHARPRLWQDRRNFAVRWIGHKPRATSLGHFIDVAELGGVANLA